MDSLRGQLLIAAPTLVDPNFHRTVVLVAEHGAEGAMGLVLNRAADATVSEAAPGLAGLVSDDDPLHVGGPVSPSSVVVLAEWEEPGEAAVLVSGDLGFVSAQADLATVAAATRRVRVFAGHAGWGPGQLDAELDDEGWVLGSPVPDDVFCAEPDGLWGAVLARKGGRFSLLARMPADPSLN